MNLFTVIFNKFSDFLLDNPTLFNNIRFFLAGDQKNTKKFVYDNIKKYKCNSVYDLGCGTGDFSEACPKNIKYLGTDISPKYIMYAKNKYKTKTRKFRIEDSLKNTKISKYDAVLLISMLHHFSDQEVNNILLTAKKRAKKIVIIADIIPNPPNLFKMLLAKLDRGKYVRLEKDKIKLINKHFTIVEKRIINSKMAVQFGAICKE